MRVTITLDSGEDVGITEILAAVTASYARRVTAAPEPPIVAPEPPVVAAAPEPPVVAVAPEPPVVAVAPEPPVVAPEPPVVAPEPPVADVDKSGRAWDASVHSSSREKTVDGLWKFRRGLDPAIRAAYLSGESVPDQAPEAPETPEQAPEAPETHPSRAAVLWTFPRIMAEVTKRGMSQPQVLAVLKASTGLDTLPQLVSSANAADNYNLFAAGLGL